jgi:hypothetical protein
VAKPGLFAAGIIPFMRLLTIEKLHWIRQQQQTGRDEGWACFDADIVAGHAELSL